MGCSFCIETPTFDNRSAFTATCLFGTASLLITSSNDLRYLESEVLVFVVAYGSMYFEDLAESFAISLEWQISASIQPRIV